MNKDRNNLVKWKRRMRCQYLISSNLVLNTYDYDLILSAWINNFLLLIWASAFCSLENWIFNLSCKAWIFISIYRRLMRNYLEVEDQYWDGWCWSSTVKISDSVVVCQTRVSVSMVEKHCCQWTQDFSIYSDPRISCNHAHQSSNQRSFIK